MFPSMLVVGFRVPLDEYKRMILDQLGLAPIQLTLNNWKLLMGLRVAFNEQGFSDLSINLLQVLFDIHANKPLRMKTPGGACVGHW